MVGKNKQNGAAGSAANAAADAEPRTDLSGGDANLEAGYGEFASIPIPADCINCTNDQNIINFITVTLQQQVSTMEMQRKTIASLTEMLVKRAKPSSFPQHAAGSSQQRQMVIQITPGGSSKLGSSTPQKVQANAATTPAKRSHKKKGTPAAGPPKRLKVTSLQDDSDVGVNGLPL
ncbi:hypothetical protein BV898_09462 [Hypsibius exemplaris]|uniref:Uncharacterized protein n=1 Tax=Hypsibius exemplaris TaxID=2072580 RepID=A0A1W0WMR9_HYPEX|nr:hypothetical protein BV898_09462 [Hypsibius exemplaris]